VDLDRAAAEDWIRAHLTPVGPIEIAHERPWSTVLRVPVGDGHAWFKACAPVQAFEPRLTGELFARWPDRVPEVLGRDDARAWLLLGDAGARIGGLGNPPQLWLRLLPRYAELQRGEVRHAQDHLAHAVPDLRLATWPARYDDLLRHDLPLEVAEIERLRHFAPRFSAVCAELATHDLPDTIQHDDLHMANVFKAGERLRVLDWGDASISHPFVSLVVTFRFLEESNHLPPTDPWYSRLRDAYLEPWGRQLVGAFSLAMRAGAFAHTFGWMRQRDALPQAAHAPFDQAFSIVLRRALRHTPDAKER
jgi:hypothetical protein